MESLVRWSPRLQQLPAADCHFTKVGNDASSQTPLPSRAAVKAASPPPAAPPVSNHVELPEHSFQGISGWLVSLVLHLTGLLALALWILPSGSGLLATVVIQSPAGNDQSAALLRLGNDPLDLPETQSAAQSLPAPNPLADLPDTQPPGWQTKLPKADIAASADPTLTQKVAGADTQQADAMFFGTSASGRRFIFILDVSGSMQARGGARFDRARDELIASVSRLREDQHFYVYLFNWSTFPMFGPSNDPGQLIPANAENIAKLKTWLYAIVPQSGTDPRAALLGAHSMQPDAIFLLSDGQFNTPPRTDPTRGWDASLFSVFDLLSRPDLPKVQINTIAFEDVVASQGMQRIAASTEGQFRFVTAPGKDAFAGANNDPAATDPAILGPEYEPQTAEAKRQMAEDILLLRRAQRLLERNRPERAKALVQDLDPAKLPRDARRTLARIRR